MKNSIVNVALLLLLENVTKSKSVHLVTSMNFANYSSRVFQDKHQIRIHPILTWPPFSRFIRS